VVRLVFAALSLLLATPALADGAATLHVGLVVTGDPGSPVVGAWTATSPVQSGTYHFEIKGGRLNYQSIVPPGPAGSAQQACDIYVTAKVDQMRTALAGIAIRYSVTSAVAIADLSGSCDPVASDYAGRLSVGEQGLTLTRGGHGELIDRVAGTSFSRAAN
jgi:hypothetical protein